MNGAEFTLHRATVRGVEIAYWREGVGGFPLVLLHGWPETKRIWLRNVRPLAEAGFEVIVPDMRGFGDSGLAADGLYDIAAESRDIEALLRDELGHSSIVTCGGDLGGVVLQDLALRFPGLVDRQVMFNTVLPLLGDAYAEAGVEVELSPVTSMAADYFQRQANDADALAAELTTPDQRRRYVAQMYGSRFWAAPGTFTPEDVEFHVEPFGDADRFRASIANYESAAGARERSELPRFMEVNPTPTLVLYGPEDHVIPRTFPRAAEVAFPDRMGTFVVPGAGHFLQWERADLLNDALRHFCPDLLRRGTRTPGEGQS
jgi:pimeloyl-ACP methyl ester carboxylesterase